MTEGVINVILDTSKFARRVNNIDKLTCQKNVCLFLTRPKYPGVENTVRPDTKIQLHKRIRCDMCSVANREHRRRERSFHLFYSYAHLPLNICHLCPK